MTSKKTIMLVCSAGMSTSLLVSKMQKSAENQGIDSDIFATAASNADDLMATKSPDILMLGPQVRYLLDNFQKEYSDIPVEVINMQDYGLMNGEKVLNEAVTCINNFKK